MDKRRAIQIMTKAAQLYKENLEDHEKMNRYLDTRTASIIIR